MIPTIRAKTRFLALDDMITLLLSKSSDGAAASVVPFLENELKSVITTARDVFLSQPMLLNIAPPINICGDIHGQVCFFLLFYQL
jgi:hypothetical protein